MKIDKWIRQGHACVTRPCIKYVFSPNLFGLPLYFFSHFECFFFVCLFILLVLSSSTYQKPNTHTLSRHNTSYFMVHLPLKTCTVDSLFLSLSHCMLLHCMCTGVYCILFLTVYSLLQIGDSMIASFKTHRFYI